MAQLNAWFTWIIENPLSHGLSFKNISKAVNCSSLFHYMINLPVEDWGKGFVTFRNSICMFGKLGESEKNIEGLIFSHILGIFTWKIKFGLLSHHTPIGTQINTNQHKKLLDISILMLSVPARAFWEGGGGVVVASPVVGKSHLWKVTHGRKLCLTWSLAVWDAGLRECLRWRIQLVY